MRTAPLFLIGSALLACAPAVAADRAATPEAALAKALDGRVAGAPVNCINLHDIQSSRIFDRTAILYDTGTRLYLNRPRIGADSLDDDDILLTKTFGSQLCSLDTVHLISRSGHFEHGFVGLGEFVPYARPPKAK